MRDFIHFVSECFSEKFAKLSGTATCEMIVEALYHMERLVNINYSIAGGKDEVLALGKLCGEWKIMRTGLETSNSNREKDLKELDTAKKLIKEYSNMQASHDKHSKKF